MTLATWRRAAWCATALIAVAIILATLGPISERPRLPMPASLERILAFAALGFCLAMARGKQFVLLAFAMVLFAGALEWAQTLTATRHGRLIDFDVKAAAGVVGIAFSALVGWRIKRRLPTVPPQR